MCPVCLVACESPHRTDNQQMVTGLVDTAERDDSSGGGGVGSQQ